MMTLEEMGELLRQERERREMTLEAAAAEMRISKRYLIAFEEGRTNHLPHPVYAKGFIKSYARLLGLDPEQMGNVLSYYYADEDDDGYLAGKGPGASGAGVRSKLLQAAKPDKAAASAAGRGSFLSLPERGGFRPPLWLVVPLAVVFAGLIWFFFSSFGKDVTGTLSGTDTSKASQKAFQAQDVQAGAPVSSQPQSDQTRSEPPPGQKTDAPERAAQFGGAVWGVVQPQGVPLPSQAGAQASVTPGEAANPEKPASESQFAATGKQTVEINAKEPAALEIFTEDGQTRSFTLVKGQRLSLRFNNKISVRFGEGALVAVKLNGKDYPLGGRTSGQSVTFP